jgi:hypothetical protein
MEFWQIVPKNDGYHYLSINDDGQHFLVHKAKDRNNLGRLTFCSRENANKYLDSHGMTSSFEAEVFSVGLDFFKFWQNDFE